MAQPAPSAISYANASAVFIKGVPVTPDAPVRRSRGNLLQREPGSSCGIDPEHRHRDHQWNPNGGNGPGKLYRDRHRFAEAALTTS